MCYVHVQPTVLYVNAHFDESKGGIHQVNQLLAGIQILWNAQVIHD